MSRVVTSSIARKVFREGELWAEARDTEKAIRFWHREASNGGPPHLTAFRFDRLKTDWGYRFVISTDDVVSAAVFIVYGSQFARLLQLPKDPRSHIPLITQIPPRYRELFAEGLTEALAQPEPVSFSGSVWNGHERELYRAVFMQLQSKQASRPLICGSFNFRPTSG
jgi:hypothetical protein